MRFSKIKRGRIFAPYAHIFPMYAETRQKYWICRQFYFWVRYAHYWHRWSCRKWPIFCTAFVSLHTPHYAHMRKSYCCNPNNKCASRYHIGLPDISLKMFSCSTKHIIYDWFTLSQHIFAANLWFPRTLSTCA